MAGFKAEIKGLDALLKKLDKMPKEVQTAVVEEIHDFSDRVSQKAKQRVPKDAGAGAGIASAISSHHLPSGAEVVVAKKYAAYVEFGTGRYVFAGEAWITPEIEAYAKQFFVNGKGRLYPQPFLFNSFFEEKKSLMDNLKKITSK